MSVSVGEMESAHTSTKVNLVRILRAYPESLYPDCRSGWLNGDCLIQGYIYNNERFL